MAHNGTMNCPTPMHATSNGAFQDENPLDYALPLAILQICLVVVFTRVLAVLLQPLRQPRVVAEIIGGILLGPSAAGRSKKFLNTVFPKNSLTVLDTLANLGLLFFLFLVGLELDMRAVRRTGKKALAIAISGIGLPFVIGIGTSFILLSNISKGAKEAPFIVFIGVSLSITAFPVLARILAELKLLTTDVGRIAMSAAAVNDVAAWILLALAIALSGSGSPIIALWVLLCGVGFVVAAVFVLTPVFTFMARRSLEGEPVKELYICITLVLVLVASFATDTIGIHALFGAFIVGIVVPKDGPFAGVLIEKIEDIVASLLLPLYFVSSGLKTNVATISGGMSWAMLVLVIFTACFGKIVGTVAVSLAFKVPFREALAVGFLMNTKGLVELIVLNIGKDRKVLNDETFAVLVLMALFTTFITTPIVMAVYHPARKITPYNDRTIQRKNLDTELRLLTCFHSSRNVPTIINLIESSRGTRRKGRLCVYAMHLMELSERSSAISMVHKARNNGLPTWNKKPDDKDTLVIAFETYRQLSSVVVRPMTAISELYNIDEDICASASQKRSAMIILPFHKHQRVDGVMESLGHSLHQVNQRVLRHAPCSVGILVDRGLGGTTQVTASDVSFTIGVPFFGGKDDCEALAYGARMAEHPGISLTIIRFVTPPEISMRTIFGLDVGRSKHSTSKSASITMENSDDFLSEAKTRNAATVYEERTVTSKEEIITALKYMNTYNLMLVGRLPLDLPNKLIKSCDCPELGPIGSFMAATEFSTTTSVLIVQQYDHYSKPQLVVEEDAEPEPEPEPEMPDTPV
ncbi:cation/H(+) antiporter 19-like [Apium graveolens]|uniref:cation/H(+) antiporter 19-like n=1 Tax=Apium graveolens TaxID=4045 RepID=UPI003D7C0CB8